MAEEQSVEQFKGQPRLPEFAAPRRYDLFLKPDLSACAFAGAAEIALDVLAATRFLVLNAADLAVDHASISFKNQESSQELRPLEIVEVQEDEILVLGFDRVLPLGKGILRIRFTGTLNDQMKGFYRSVYEYNGEKRNMAVTQFEAADARRCFPCWDEPAFKATFRITLKVPSELVALSNMPVIEEKIDGLLKTLSFQESPIMSTYLVAVVVGLFDFVEAFTPDGIRVRVYCQVGKSNQGKFALDVAVKTLDLYKGYFAVPYPLPKLDMVAIPDFASGAMENYGLVTYREKSLLYDERYSSASSKQWVAITVTHELAHQWFGNLVTMEWWTHLWLNEGFASWMSYLAADSLFPEWNIWTQFLDDTTSGLVLDALSESHPIEVEINHANEIDQIFDSISYDKGASIIRMLQSYLGAECFQSQFLTDGSSGNGQWIVPLTLCCGSYNTQKKFLLKTKFEELDIMDLIGSANGKANLLEKSSQGNSERFWIKFNIDQTGFYRVKYDDELAAGLRYAIEANKLYATDRIGILEDSYALCVACKQTLSSLLSLLDAYREEFDYTVLGHIVTISCKIANIVTDATPELADEIKVFLIILLQISAEKLGWDPKEGESHLAVMLRGDLLTALVRIGHDMTRNEAVRRFYIFLNDRNTSLLPPDTRKAAYIAVMQTVSASNRSGYESLLRIYRETDESEERVRVLSSLSSCPDPDIVLEVLNFLLSSEVRNQDAVYGLRVSREGRETAWRWLKENWDYISKTWESASLIAAFIGCIVSPFSSEEKAEEMEEFFASRTKPSFARTLKQSLERVRINARWVQSIRNDHSLEEAVKELAHKNGI
ncbi:aminopeptidase M1-B-like isoform X2 [Phoenix dactylifera]|uniref:Aminopeptidase n=1 Tax=Phoenix dactylifera TaxID=42345 RepID=A0A8B8IZM0_PHODC|nr:aminopeptidase M1-B-like isoform X2 [Phoenix dactylifera]